MRFLIFVVFVQFITIIYGCYWQISNETVTFYSEKSSNLTRVIKSEKFHQNNRKFLSQEIRLDGQCQELDDNLRSSSIIRIHDGFECFIFKNSTCDSIAELLTDEKIIENDTMVTHVMCEKCRSFWSSLWNLFG